MKSRNSPTFAEARRPLGASVPPVKAPVRNFLLAFGLGAGLLGFVGAGNKPPETYRRADVDSLGQLRIITSTKRQIVPAKVQGQVGFEKAAISADGRAVGWLALFPNAATSYLPAPRFCMT